jgi:hypothetical protein
MTPKEKAIEIYTKMFNQIYNSYSTDFVVRQCALIAVNEVINSLKSFAESDDWKQVKEEIEKAKRNQNNDMTHFLNKLKELLEKTINRYSK